MPPSRPPKPSGNMLTRKTGPLANWIWMAIVLGLALAYELYKSYQTAKTTTNQSSAEGSTSANPSQQQPGVVVQDFSTQVNQPTPATAPASPTTATTTTRSSSAPAYSWTNTGQKWSAEQLAKELGIPLNELQGTNQQAINAIKNPKATMRKGAKFTYSKQPSQVTATTSTTKTT